MDENRMFDQQVHDAYKRVSLSDEARERMLGALLAAQAERQGEPTEATAAEAHPEGQPRRATATVLAGGKRGAHAAARSRRLPVWLPLAAAAACVFVVVGVVGLSWRGFDSNATMVADTAAKGAAEPEEVYATSLDEEQDAAVANSYAMGATGESVAAESDAAAEPDLAAEEAAELQLVDLYPRITLENGTSYTALVDGMYTTEVDADSVGALVGAGTASPFDADDSVACEVFELADSDAFAVRYEGESTYWYCTRLDD